MDIQQLRNLSLVAKMGSITKAAQVLHVSQPNLSMNIKRLESELDVTLFDRVKTHIILTPIGQTFLDYVDRSLATLDEGIEKLHAVYRVEEKTIRIIASDLSYLIPVTATYSESHSMPVHAEIVSEEEIVPMLINGDADCAIAPDGDYPAAITWTPTYTEVLGILCSSANPLAERNTVSVTDLKEENFIINFNLYPKAMLGKIFIDAGFAPHIICESCDNSLIGPMVADNFGIAFVDANAATAFRLRNSTAPVKLIPFTENITRTIGMLQAKERRSKFSIEDVRQAYASFFADSFTGSGKNDPPQENRPPEPTSSH